MTSVEVRRMLVAAGKVVVWISAVRRANEAATVVVGLWESVVAGGTRRTASAAPTTATGWTQIATKRVAVQTGPADLVDLPASVAVAATVGWSDGVDRWDRWVARRSFCLNHYSYGLMRTATTR